MRWMTTSPAGALSCCLYRNCGCSGNLSLAQRRSNAPPGSHLHSAVLVLRPAGCERLQGGAHDLAAGAAPPPGAPAGNRGAGQRDAGRRPNLQVRCASAHWGDCTCIEASGETLAGDYTIMCFEYEATVVAPGNLHIRHQLPFSVCAVLYSVQPVLATTMRSLVCTSYGHHSPHRRPAGSLIRSSSAIL